MEFNLTFGYFSFFLLYVKCFFLRVIYLFTLELSNGKKCEGYLFLWLDFNMFGKQKIQERKKEREGHILWSMTNLLMFIFCILDCISFVDANWLV